MLVDGKELDGSYYTVSGETKITLNVNYLNGLTTGEHQVDFAFKGGSASSKFTVKEGVKEVQVNLLQAGTYTVACNIWFEKADTGLPMNPHITNSSFPPKDPVDANATLVVDADGRARVTVPICIQSKVMTIQSISGLNIVDYATDGSGNLTSITVDLGILEDPNSVITKSCTVQLQMGDLAMSISGFDRDHTWPATFQLNLSGVATRTGTKLVSVGQNGAVATGDETPVNGMAALCLISILALAGIAVQSRKEKL